MSFAGAQWVLNGELVKQEIYKRSNNVFWKLLWNYWLKTSIVVDWPRGWAPLDETGTVHAESSDPNTWYRWWLERYVGKQGWAWDWQLIIGATTHVPGYEHLYGDRLEIKFRDPKMATLFILRFAK